MNKEPELKASLESRVEHRVWKLWGYVRDNKDSLDSERTCKYIQKLLDLAVSEERAKREEAERMVENLRRDLAAKTKRKG